MQRQKTLIDLLAEVESREDQRAFADELRQLQPKIEAYLGSVRNLPYTLHDWRHSKKLERLCITLLPPAFLQQMNPLELFLLTLALWLHDAGMVPDRQDQSDEEVRLGHHTRIRRRITEAPEELPFLAYLDPVTRDILGRICESHCLDSISDPAIPEHTLVDLTGVRFRLLCAVLRLCDICDVTFERAPWFIQRNFVFSPDSRRHWETHALMRGLTVRHESQGTRFLLEAEYASEQDCAYISATARAIETELKSLRDVFRSSGWLIETTITKEIREAPPEAEAAVTVLPPNIYRLLMEHIYDGYDIFVRELIQNAIDSCKIMRKTAQKQGVEYNAVINVCIYRKGQQDRRPYAVKVEDNGVGMNQMDVKMFLLQIAHGIKNSQEVAALLSYGSDPEHLIAEFGIGFLSVFAVASGVTVKTKKDGFSGLDISFPDFAQDYERIAERRVRIKRGSSLSRPGTMVVVVLNELGRNLDIAKCVEKHCRNVRFPMCVEQKEYASEGDMWMLHREHASCTAVRKRFMGETAPFLIQFSFEETGMVEGVLGYSPSTDTNALYISQEGIFIEDCVDLVPPGLTGIQGEVNLKAGNLRLTASRNHIVRNDKHEDLRNFLMPRFSQLFTAITAKGVNPWADDENRVLKMLNARYNALRGAPQQLREFFTAVEDNIHITREDGKRKTSLKRVRLDCEESGVKEVYQTIDHGVTRGFIPLNPIDGYEIDVVPMIGKKKAALLHRAGKVVLTSRMSSRNSEQFYPGLFLTRQFYADYFASFGIKLYQLEPSDWTGLASVADGRNRGTPYLFRGLCLTRTGLHGKLAAWRDWRELWFPGSRTT